MLNTEKLKGILGMYFRKGVVAELLPRIEKYIPSNGEFSEEDVDNIGFELSWFCDENPKKVSYLPSFYEKIIVGQICGKIPVEKEPLSSVETVRIDVSYADAQRWLDYDVNYPNALKFKKKIKKAFQKKLDPFEVPLGYPELDLWGRLIFKSYTNEDSMDSCRERRRNFCWRTIECLQQAKVLGNYTRTYEVGDEDHFMLYLIYLMNQYFDRYGEVIFDAVVADEDYLDDNFDFSIISEIQMALFGPIGELYVTVRNGREKATSIFVPGYCDAKGSVYDGLEEYPFFIKKISE